MRLMHYVVTNITKKERVMTTVNMTKANNKLEEMHKAFPQDTFKMVYKFGNL